MGFGVLACHFITISRAGLLPTGSHKQPWSTMVAIAEHTCKIALIYCKLLPYQSKRVLCFLSHDFVLCDALYSETSTLRCPVTVNSKQSMEVLMRFATKLASGEVSGLTHSMMPRRPLSFYDLPRLYSSVFSVLELFLWLQKKFPP
jgi:hypothetical protein